jgi:hypothetical protein
VGAARPNENSEVYPMSDARALARLEQKIFAELEAAADAVAERAEVLAEATALDDLVAEFQPTISRYTLCWHLWQIVGGMRHEAEYPSDDDERIEGGITLDRTAEVIRLAERQRDLDREWARLRQCDRQDTTNGGRDGEDD